MLPGAAGWARRITLWLAITFATPASAQPPPPSESPLFPEDVNTTWTSSTALGLIGAALTMNGNYKDALPYHVECRTLRGYMLPADDVRIAGALFGQGVYHAEQGDQGSAEPFLDRTLEIYVATLGPDHPSVAAVRCPSVGSTTRTTSAIAPTICSEERCVSPSFPPRTSV